MASKYLGKTHFAEVTGSGYEWANLLSRYLPPGIAPQGNVYFVDSNSGTNSAGYGFSPAAAFKTLDYALGQTRPDTDDWVFLLPNHVETLTAAGTSLGNGGVFAGPTLSNGVTVQGIGNGRNRPTLNYTTAIGASFNVSALNFTIRNCVFTPNGFGAITAAMNVTGADFSMDNCEWQLSTGTNAPVLGILTAATATRFTVTNSRFLGPATSTQTCTAAIQHEVGIDYVIKGCEFMGKFTQAIKNVAAILGGLIHDNSFHMYSSNLAIVVAAGSTPVISRNRIVVAAGTAPITGTIASYVNNSWTTEGVGISAGAALTF
jgi:hypothetical protein